MKTTKKGAAMSIHRRADFCLQDNPSLGFDSHFEDTVAMLGKGPVRIGNLPKFEVVRDQWRQIRPSVQHHLH